MSRLATFLACLFVPAMAVAQDAVDPWVARAAANYRAVREHVGDRTMRISDARGEGRTLILDIELLPTAAAMIEPPNVLSIYSASICADANAARFFTEGRMLRVNVVRDGRPLGTAATDRCPGAIGEGLSAATFAGALQSFVGRDEDGVRIIAVRAEGATLIVALDVLPGTTITTEAAAGHFLTGFCSRSDTNSIFFDRGLTLRIDTSMNGRTPRTGTPIRRCPQR